MVQGIVGLTGCATLAVGPFCAEPAATPAADHPFGPATARIVELREQLLDRPNDRSILAPQVESLLGALGDAARRAVEPEPWVSLFLAKGYMLLAALDRSREADHLRSARRWLDGFHPRRAPMKVRRINGVDVLFRGDASRREVALTFDGGPSPATAALLDYLRAERVRATFFLIGCFVRKRPGCAGRRSSIA